MNINVTRENKAELGMNRNDFFEYKKERSMELAKRGATVGEIAKDLGMSEKEMYAFLSRNFGGVRRMRHLDTTEGVPQMKMASMPTTKEIPNIATLTKENKPATKKETDKPISILSAFTSVLNTEKEKILAGFRSDLEAESKAIVGEIETGISQMKIEMLKKFKDDIMKDLSELAKGL